MVLLLRRPVRQLCLGPNVAHRAGPERCPPGRRGAAPTSCPPQSPGRFLRHLTSPAASWVIRRPLVAMALEALLSVACEGEQAATPSAATSSPSHRGRSQPSAFANVWPLCPGADIQPLIDADPAGARSASPRVSISSPAQSRRRKERRHSISGPAQSSTGAMVAGENPPTDTIQSPWAAPASITTRGSNPWSLIRPR